MRKRYKINGIVQGVGFRPFVARLAQNLNLTGFVLNTGQGVTIEVQGPEQCINSFEEKLNDEKPHGSFYIEFDVSDINEIDGENKFVILKSQNTEDLFTFIPPDLATCSDCVNDIFDNTNRRYLYPLTNCTNCGPRYTVIEKLPYDRPNTSMKAFPMCHECETEYTDPKDRRFHAQPVACPKCGPKTYLVSKDGNIIDDEQLMKTADLLLNGHIVSIKGLGGFLLACDATNKSSLEKLRQLKGRPKEPFALMAALDTIKVHCFVNDEQETLLRSSAAPIVLLKKKAESTLPDNVAPLQNYLGFMLPYTPIHHMLLHLLPPSFILVMTSANVHGEVIYYENSDIGKLLQMSEYVLTHDRAIVTHVDDSVVQTLTDGPHIIRRSRGYVPLPVKLSSNDGPNILATGGDQKATPALAKNGYAVLGQYVGDLDNPRTMNVYENIIEHLKNLFQIKPQVVATDKHPTYYSHKYAYDTGLPVIEVQHHVAHALSAMEENRLSSAVAVVYDGTGYGDDGKLWGSEILFIDVANYERLYHFDYMPLVGGEKAIKEPWRLAAAFLTPLEAEKRFGNNGKRVNELARTWHAPLACGMGRIFDTVSALLNICTYATYEGQPAQELQMIAELSDETGDFSDNVRIQNNVINTKDLVDNVISLIHSGYDKSDIAKIFHNTVVSLTVNILERIGRENIVLTGGSFQNALLYGNIYFKLKEKGFHVFRNRNVPMNDNGIALGQIAYVLRRFDNNVSWNTYADKRN